MPWRIALVSGLVLGLLWRVFFAFARFGVALLIMGVVIGAIVLYFRYRREKS